MLPSRNHVGACSAAEVPEADHHAVASADVAASVDAAASVDHREVRADQHLEADDENVLSLRNDQGPKGIQSTQQHPVAAV